METMQIMETIQTIIITATMETIITITETIMAIIINKVVKECNRLKKIKKL